MVKAGSGELPSIRISTLADLPHIVALRQQWSASRGFVGGTDESHDPDDPADSAGFADRVLAWWERQGDSRICWLAFDGHGHGDGDGDADNAIGMANLAVFERMPHVGVTPGRWGYVGNVWVDPAYRHRGVGSALMTSVIEWCRAGSFERVVLNPSEMSAPMYGRLGFRPADTLLRLDL